MLKDACAICKSLLDSLLVETTGTACDLAYIAGRHATSRPSLNPLLDEPAGTPPSVRLSLASPHAVGHAPSKPLFWPDPPRAPRPTTPALLPYIASSPTHLKPCQRQSCSIPSPPHMGAHLGLQPHHPTHAVWLAAVTHSAGHRWWRRPHHRPGQRGLLRAAAQQELRAGGREPEAAERHAEPARAARRACRQGQP